MEETLKMMKNYLIGNEGGKSLKELIAEYKINKSPNILAYLYVSNYGIICRISNLYPILDDTDKASFCLQELDKCMLSYNEDISKFITYFCTYYRNRLLSEYGILNTNKRKIIFSYEPLDDSLNETYLDDYFDIADFANTYNLNKSEELQCDLINRGYTPKEICKMLHKSAALIYKRNNSIKKKIFNYGIKFS